MENKRIVVALGGNALGYEPEQQLINVRLAAKQIARFVQMGYQVILGHGNGPQVGLVQGALSYSAKEGGNTPSMPFAECNAMTQGYIGYHLQQALQEALKEIHMPQPVVSVVTQVVVDEKDEAFSHPTKPIGTFCTKEEAEREQAEKGYTFVEDSGRGYRRVVASPKPIEIVELDAVRTLSTANCVVIAAGGGGIPVIRTEEGLRGIDAVIDKDLSASLMAGELGADGLVILTAVDRMYLNYRTPEEQGLDHLDVATAKQYIREGHFAAGSMLPKVEACIRYLEQNPKGFALITSLEQAAEALSGRGGTRLTATL